MSTDDAFPHHFPTLWRLRPSIIARLATSVCQLRHDQMERGPTEPHAGRSTFLLSFGGAGGGYYRVVGHGGPLMRGSVGFGHRKPIHHLPRAALRILGPLAILHMRFRCTVFQSFTFFVFLTRLSEF